MKRIAHKRIATKDDLANMPTIAELSKTLEQYPTKNDLKEALKPYATKSDIISFKDTILAEIKKMRDEIALVLGYKDQIEDHDVRIEKLEKHAGFSSL